MHKDNMHIDTVKNETIKKETTETEKLLHSRNEHVCEYELPNSVFHHGF